MHWSLWLLFTCWRSFGVLIASWRLLSIEIKEPGLHVTDYAPNASSYRNWGKEKDEEDEKDEEKEKDEEEGEDEREG